jgi:hypothetical protein
MNKFVIFFEGPDHSNAERGTGNAEQRTEAAYRVGQLMADLSDDVPVYAQRGVFYGWHGLQKAEEFVREEEAGVEQLGQEGHGLRGRTGARVPAGSVLFAHPTHPPKQEGHVVPHSAFRIPR